MLCFHLEGVWRPYVGSSRPDSHASSRRACQSNTCVQRAVENLDVFKTMPAPKITLVRFSANNVGITSNVDTLH